MCDPCRLRRSNQFMMGRQIFGKCLIFSLFKNKPGSHKRQMKNHIDLVKSQPVFYQTFISCKKHGHKLLIKINHLSVFPTAILFDQIDRTVKMCNRNQRLNSIFMTFFKKIFIKLQSFFIGFFLITIWKNPGPGNRKPVCLKSHFTKHGNIFSEMMIHIYGFHCRIVMFTVRLQHFKFSQAHRKTIFSSRAYIYICKASPAFPVSSLTLIGSGSTAP